jgi:hypothetical protein
LLNTAPEPGENTLAEREIGKHAGGGMGKRGEVFKYQEFVASVAGGASVDGKAGRDE